MNAQKQSELTPLQQYIEYLLYNKLNQDNKAFVLKKLRKLPWDNDEIRQFVLGSLYNLCEMSVEKISCIAATIGGLNCYYSISCNIVDAVCEEIRIGLDRENNYGDIEEDFMQEQRRLVYVKFLGMNCKKNQILFG